MTAIVRRSTTPAVVVAATDFDIAVVDYERDDGKGDELVRWLIVEHPRLPAIAVSARSEGNDALLAAGVRAVCPRLPSRASGSRSIWS